MTAQDYFTSILAAALDLRHLQRPRQDALLRLRDRRHRLLQRPAGRGRRGGGRPRDDAHGRPRLDLRPRLRLLPDEALPGHLMSADRSAPRAARRSARAAGETDRRVQGASGRATPGATSSPGVNLKIRRGEVLCILGPSGTGQERDAAPHQRPDAARTTATCASSASRSSALSEEELSPVRRRARHALPGRRALRLDERRAEHRLSRCASTPTKTPDEIAALVAEKLDDGGPARASRGRCRRSSRAACASAWRWRARSRSSPRSSSTTSRRPGLDPVSSEKIAQLIVDINVRLQTTSVVVTHDIVDGPHGRGPRRVPAPGALPVHRHVRRGGARAATRSSWTISAPWASPAARASSRRRRRECDAWPNNRSGGGSASGSWSSSRSSRR